VEIVGARKRILILALSAVWIIGYGARLYGIDDSEHMARPVLPMVRAMGDAFTAVANDENTVFYNPAGYAIITKSITSVFSLGIKLNIDDTALRLYNALISGTDVTSSGNIDTYLSDTTVALGITGPIFIGRVGNNFGFAFFNSINPLLDTRPGGILPSARFDAFTDIGIVGGYGISVPFLEGLYAGANLKLLLRTKSEIDGTVLAVLDTVSDTSEIPVSRAVGFGSDIGLLYIPHTWISFGLTAHDFFGTRFSEWKSVNRSEDLSSSMIKPRIAFGIAFYPFHPEREPLQFRNFVVAFDYKDLLDYTSVFSNIKFGASFDTLRILTLRAGIDGGYLSGGIGFNLNIFHIYLAYFVDELGAYAGANPTQNLMLDFVFKW
jgi:hypothetical protein